MLRYPEISATATSTRDSNGTASRIDIDTEYLLVGSLVSWSIALALVPFAAR